MSLTEKMRAKLEFDLQQIKTRLSVAQVLKAKGDCAAGVRTYVTDIEALIERDAHLKPVHELLLEMVEAGIKFSKETDRILRNNEGDLDFVIFNFKDVREEYFDALSKLERFVGEG